LVHGMRTEARRVLSTEVLEALGIAPISLGTQVTAGKVAYIHTAQLHSGLARLLAVREVVGLRNPGHSVVKLLNPCSGAAILVSSYTHPEYVSMLTTTFGMMGSNAILSRGLEGEVAADPRRTAKTIGFINGQEHTLQEQQPGTAEIVPGLPSAIDIATTAQYTSEVLRGIKPVPGALAQQVEYILRLSQHHNNTKPVSAL
jgi:anthranilate phosphoribosyltransferase